MTGSRQTIELGLLDALEPQAAAASTTAVPTASMTGRANRWRFMAASTGEGELGLSYGDELRVARQCAWHGAHAPL